MKPLIPIALILLTVILVTSCEDSQMTGLDDRLLQSQVNPGDADRLTVMTRNLYIGAEVDSVIAALASPDPTDDIPQLLFAIETLQKTDYPARAAAIADEIAASTPLFVGLQEVSEIHLNLTPLGLDIVIDLDFLPLLEAELANRGLSYEVAATVTNIEAMPLPGISLVDMDAILFDANRVIDNGSWGKTFDYNIGTVAPGVELKRGWVAIEATVDGESYTIVNTHLESGQHLPELPMLRAAQMTEIVLALGDVERAIVMGDLNDWPDTPMYQVLVGAGFTDIWADMRPGTSGYTCCHAKDLSNLRTDFNERIDYIWTRGIGQQVGGVQGRVFHTGTRPRDRVEGPEYEIWPSDHAGLVALLLTK